MITTADPPWQALRDSAGKAEVELLLELAAQADWPRVSLRLLHSVAELWDSFSCASSSSRGSTTAEPAEPPTSSDPRARLMRQLLAAAMAHCACLAPLAAEVLSLVEQLQQCAMAANQQQGGAADSTGQPARHENQAGSSRVRMDGTACLAAAMAGLPGLPSFLCAWLGALAQAGLQRSSEQLSHHSSSAWRWGDVSRAVRLVHTCHTRTPVAQPALSDVHIMRLPDVIVALSNCSGSDMAPQQRAATLLQCTQLLGCMGVAGEEPALLLELYEPVVQSVLRVKGYAAAWGQVSAPGWLSWGKAYAA